jgi:hypothetical protein
MNVSRDRNRGEYLVICAIDLSIAFTLCIYSAVYPVHCSFTEYEHSW